MSTNSSVLVTSLVGDKEGGGATSGRDLEALISAVNPITESLGNAKTSRNNNSSRFGKFVELRYCAEGYITNAHIQTYLLETVRVTSQVPGERNYHLFYELFAGLTEDVKQNWQFESLEDFAYLNSSGEYHRHDGESDAENFSKLMDALTTIHMSAARLEQLIQVAVAILHVGNITFASTERVGEDAAIFSPHSARNVSMACTLLGISEDSLLAATSTRAIKVAGNVICKNLNVEGASMARDVLCRTIYDLLFRSALNDVNRALSFGEDESDAASFIGVLDIFGFEYFEKNSFEQLCINYANEKLQDHFNFAIFKSEREVYEEEGIKWTFRDYPDNAERLELFEHKRTGIFLLCDEQLKIPKPSDDKLAKSLYTRCVGYNHFESSQAEQIRGEFVVHHFACSVRYSISGFVEKNRNEVAAEIFQCFDSSSREFVQGLTYVSDDPRAPKKPLIDVDVTTVTRTRGDSGATIKSASHHHGLPAGKKTTSVTTQFSRQLQDLVGKIRSTRSHFIRCIKPNNELQANNFDDAMVMKQLRCGGALGAVQVSGAVTA